VIFSVLSVSAFEGKGYSIQIGSTQVEDNAKSEVARMKEHSQTAYYVKADIPEKGTYYRIRVGRFASLEAARTQAELMRRSNVIHDFLITTFEGPATMAFTNSAYASTKQAVAVVKNTDIPAVTSRKQQAANSNQTSSQTIANSAPPPSVTSRSNTSSAVDRPVTIKPTADSRPNTTTTGTTDTTASDVATTKKNVPSLSASSAKPSGLWESQLSLTNQTLRKVFFVDEKCGWVVGDGGTILHTENSGRTWQRQLSGVAINLTDVFFKNQTTGWALGGGTRGADLRDLQNPEEVVMLHTADGGRTWERQPGVNALAVYFINAKQGWLVGNYGEVSHTEDGGKTWQKSAKAEEILGKAPQSNDFVFAFTGVTFINETEGWLIGNNYTDTAAYVGGLFHTKDGGRTWQRIQLGIVNKETAVAGTLRDVHFSDSEHGVISVELQSGANRKAMILKTADGGQTWQEQPVKVDGLASIYMLDTKNGWSASIVSNTRSGELLSTTDGGISWNEEFKSSAALYSVHFPSPLEGWAVGAKGTILHFSRSAKAAPINN